MSLAKSFAPQIEAQQEPQQIDIEDALKDRLMQVPTGAKKPQAPKRTPAAPTTRGKSSNPEYEPVKVLVKTDFRDRATSKWQKQHGRKRDFSDLVEHLLAGYLGA